MKKWLFEKRWRIILSGMVIVALPIVALSSFVYFVLIEHIRENIFEGQKNVAIEIATHTQAGIQDDIHTGKLIASSPWFHKAVMNNDREELTSHLKSFHLRSFIDKIVSIETAFVVNTKGVLIANFPEDPSVLNKDFSNREWFKGSSKSRQLYVSEFYLRLAEPKRYLFSIGIPIKTEKQEVIGILGLQPETDYIKNILSYIPFVSGQKVYLVDKKGKLIFHSDYAVDRIIDFSGIPVVQKVLRGEDGIETIKQDGVSMVTAYHPIRELGWGVVVQRTEKEVFGHIRKITLALFIFAGVMLLIGVYFATKRSDLLFSLRRLSDELDNRVREKTRELQFEKDKLLKIFEAMEDGVYIVNRQYNIEYINPFLEKEYGQWQGVKCYKYFHDRTEVCPWCPNQRVWAGETVRWEWYSFKNNKTYDLIDSPIMNPDGTVSKLEIFRDITERRKAEEKIKEYSEHLEEMVKERTKETEEAKSQADTANRAKSDFLANMSHELRTPLNAILGFSEVLELGIAGPLTDGQKEPIRDIHESGQYLLSLINDILDLSKVEAGKMELDLSEVKVGDLINSSLIMFREKAMKHGIKLISELEEGIGDIEADDRKIKQVLFNLLSNAFKFTPDGGSVSVTARRVGSQELGVRSWESGVGSQE